jgi:uncharacterized membrane protein (DUF106 family)
LKEQIIYLKGTASGFYKSISKNHSGHYTFNTFDFQTIDIRNSEVVIPFNSNELKIGLYHEFICPIEEVRVFINETDFIQEPIDELLFTDIKIGEVLSINSEVHQSYTANVYYKLKKRIIEPIKKKEPLLPIFNIIKNKTIDINTARVENTTNDEETIQDNTKTVTNQNTENRNFFNLMLGSFIISILGFMVLFFLFGLNPFTWLLPIFFLIIMLIEGLKTRFPGSNNPLQPKRNFLNLIGWIILFYACYRLMSNSFGIKSALLALLGLGFILLSRTGRMLKFIGGLFSLFAIIALLSQFNFFNPKKGTKKDDNIEHDNTDEDKWDYKPEEVTDTIYSKENDTIAVTYLKHNLKWNDNNQNPHQALLLVRKDYFNIANIKRNQLEIKNNDFREYYHQIYSNLINQNKSFLDSVAKEYSRIGKTENLNRQQFADMVVTSIQNIPYYLVHDLTHREADLKYGGFISDYHQTGKPCLDQIKFGVQAPVEFIGNFKGDCDTRSLFLFHVLSKFGYNVVMLGSEQYSHCIVGISGNYSGDFVSYNGLKYYVWETTATGFTPGNISPECGNMRYWVVELAN